MNTKQKRKSEMFNSFIIVFEVLFFTSGFMMALFGMYLHVHGKESFDSGHNMAWLEANYNINLCDYTNKGNCLESHEVVALGSNQMQQGLYYIIVGVFMMGYMSFRHEILLWNALENGFLSKKK